ncbi:MAG: uracil phosphoribosyltransferase [Succiniclasticum sp.]|nr:uracil phosphoribosyltransferase [Succiniclasticum sp.]MDY6087623.1 uracil phosphoribosyltransferase [Succiniclasticum sp.]
MKVHVVEHPLIAHKLTMMRDKNCNSKNFRELLKEIASLMTYEVTRDWRTEAVRIETPLEETDGVRLKDEVTIIPILRAGLGLLNGVLEMIPHAHVGHIGLYRDPVTHQPHEYYCGLPKQMDAKCIVVDPMLATGGSAAAAITMLKEKGLHDICLLVLVAAPEGIELINKEHPDVEIYTAAVDRQLNEKAYILPGLGDAGDRVFGTL